MSKEVCRRLGLTPETCIYALILIQIRWNIVSDSQDNNRMVAKWHTNWSSRHKLKLIFLDERLNDTLNTEAFI